MAFIDQGEFEAMKTLSGRRAPHCDKDQFHAKMTEYLNRFRDIVVEHRGLNKRERIRKMALLLPYTFAFICLPRGFGHLYESW